jgi:hypothetical protein
MDKYFERLVKQLQDISEVVSAFDSEAVQLRVVDQLLPFLERNGKRHNIDPENELASISKPSKSATAPKEKKPGLKKSLMNLIEDSFFDEEKSIRDIVKQLNESGHEYVATQVSGILLTLVKDEQLARYQSSVNNRFVYIKHKL